MNFRVELSEPTAPSAIEAALKAQIDEWVATTPQATDDEAVKSLDWIAETRQRVKETDGVSLRKAVADHAAVVKKNSAKLDATHAGAVKLMEAASKAAVVQASAMGGAAFRVTIAGHYELPPKDGITARAFERLSVNVDRAG